MRIEVRRMSGDLAAVVALAAAVTLFLSPLVFQHKAPDLSDIRSYYYPGWTYFRDLARSGSSQRWCPFIYCGFPLFADSELGLFYPLNRVLWLFPPMGGLIASLLIHYLLTAFFSYAYARYMGLNPLPALTSSLSFSLGGAMAAHLVHPNMIWASAYLPLFLLLLEIGLRKRSAASFLVMSLVVGLQYLAGFLMIPLMEALIVPVYLGIYALKEKHNGERMRAILWGLGGSATAFVVGTALGAVQNLPSYHLVKESYRAGGLDSRLADVGSLPPLQLLGLLFPRAFGKGVAQGGYLGAWTFEETYSYVGVIPLILSPFALRRPRDRASILFATLGLTFLLLSLGNAGLLWPLVRRIPGFHVLKGSSRFMLVTGFSLSMLGGLGMQRLTEAGYPDPKRRRDPNGTSAPLMSINCRDVRALVAVLAFASVPPVLLHLDPFRFRDFVALVAGTLKGRMPASPERIVQGLARYFSLSRPEFLLPFAAAVLVITLRRIIVRHPERGKRLLLALTLLASADVLIFTTSLFPFTPRTASERIPGVVEYLSESCEGRVALLTETGVPESEYRLAPNRLLPQEIPTISGFSTIPPQRMDHFLSQARGQSIMNAYRLLGVEYLVSELVYVKGTAFDLSLGLKADGWLSGVTLRLPSPDPPRLGILLTGNLFNRSAKGRWDLILQTSNGERLRVSLQKRPGENDPEVLDDSPPGCASSQVVSFRSPGHGRGRKGLFIEIDLRAVKAGDNLAFLVCGSPSSGEVRVLGITEITATGRSYPLLPYELSYMNGRFAVFQVPEKMEKVRALTRVRWHRDWKDAAKDALQGVGSETAHLVEAEVEGSAREILHEMKDVVDPPRLGIERSPDRWRVITSSSDAFVLTLAQNYMRGWRALLDDERVHLFSVDGVLTGVAVPAGEHQVILEYEPPGLKAGYAVSLTTLILLFLLAPLVYIYRRRERVKKG